MKDTRYDNIINLTRPISKRHPKMSLLDRAAQFSPFAALSGFKDGVKETARKTATKKDLDENEKNIINENLIKLSQYINTSKKSAEVVIEYFVADSLKDGGEYHTKKGKVKKIDLYKHNLTFTDSTHVNIEDLIRLDCEDIK